MIGCVDVQYEDDKATAALVVFRDWSSETVVAQRTITLDVPSAYIPGEFYKRELPCVVAVLEASPCEISTLLIDGYVWLGVNEHGDQVRGLGAHLFDELKQRIAIIGVAKTPYKSSNAIPVIRGTSKRPVYVSAAGIDLDVAVECVRQMQGEHRLPTMLKLTDHLARHGMLPL